MLLIEELICYVPSRPVLITVYGPKEWYFRIALNDSIIKLGWKFEEIERSIKISPLGVQIRVVPLLKDFSTGMRVLAEARSALTSLTILETE